MNNLEKIQKTVNVLKIITLILIIVAFAGAAFTLVAGSIFLASESFPLEKLWEQYFANEQMPTAHEFGIIMLCESAVMIVEAIVSILVYGYFKSELQDGTPFTKKGANKVRNLGIIFIAAEILIGVFYSLIKEKFPFVYDKSNNIGGIIFGVALILLAVVFRYGAELEEKAKINNTKS